MNRVTMNRLTMNPKPLLKSLRFLLALSVFLSALCLFSTRAEAQAGDVRSVPPIIMMLVDSSGSMQTVGECVCQTPACSECLPDCSVASPERNRWATVVEALTGTIEGYTCQSVNRNTASFAGEPDHRYFLPHIEARGIPCTSAIDCPSDLTCSADDTEAVGDTGLCQRTDGILDVYRERAKFGLMTFDATNTFVGQPELVTEAYYQTRLGDASDIEGGYSYGGARPFSFPGCGEPYMLDNGARNEQAGAGRLVSVGVETVTPIEVVNRNVQGSLLAENLRPYGATPIAGMLTDANYYLTRHPDTRAIQNVGENGDPYARCRRRYAILLTDGIPTSDMRGAPYFCDALGTPVGAGGCPYETPIVQAAQMLSDGVIDGLYVVGFNVDEGVCGGDSRCESRARETIRTLNDLAAAGGTTEAIFANDRASLSAALSHIMDQAAPGTTTRTIPAFGSSGAGAGSAQLQFNTGFQLSTDPSVPWTGVLERRRYECNGLAPEAQPIEPEDRFHELLNAQTSTFGSAGRPRRLLTVLPSDPTTQPSALEGDAVSDISSLPLPGSGNVSEQGLTLRTFDTAYVLPANLSVSTEEERDAVVAWVHGDPGTVRETRRMGSIYNSSPTLVAAPSSDILDEGYNLFRQRPEVLGRPTMLYVGTNDGVLHAFAASDHEFADFHPLAGERLSGGTELWGFIPPALLSGLNAARGGHQWLMDGTPVVRDVFFARELGVEDTGTEYHTILVAGFRAGGRSFFALDVTDPINPEFLWQRSASDIYGETYGTPTTAQVFVEMDGIQHERGVVVLTGGKGRLRGTGSCSASNEAPTSRDKAVPDGGRATRRCWEREGRGLEILDAATGRPLFRAGPDVFPAPLSAGASAFLGDTGTIATHLFVTDDDGVIWRVDLSNGDPAQWTVEAFYDIYRDMGYADAQPAAGAPILSTDLARNVVILQGTGDLDRLESTSAVNRVVSITEEIQRDTTGVIEGASANENWVITLERGEQVTGPLDLYQGNVYFGSFHAASDATNACELGESRIWGVSYLESTNGIDPEPALESTPGSGVFDRRYIDSSIDSNLSNRIVMGVAVTQRPTCISGRNVTETDPYVGSRQTYRVDAAGQPQFELVAQLSGGEAGEAGASVGELTRTLPQPVAFTQTHGFAGTVE